MSDAENPSDDFLRWVATVAWRVARWVLDDDSLAEDVAQETVLRTIEHFAEIEASTVNAWVCTVARNCAIDMIRRRRREHLTDDPRAVDALGDSGKDIESYLEFEEIVVQVLPERLRMIARLRYQEDLDTRTIAERTGKADGTVRNNLVKIHALVRASLGVDLPE